MLPRNPATEKIGFALTRIVVPLWILAGVVMKLHAGDPRLLPAVIWRTARDWGIDLGHLLYTLIGLEMFAIAVMVLLARFAKPMAIFMLAAFCLILIGEMARGSESCGCFGKALTIKPWQMLLADGALLLAVVLFPAKRPAAGARTAHAANKPAWIGSAAVAALLLIVGLTASFALRSALHPEWEQVVQDDDDGETDDATRNPSPRSLPGFWYTQNLESWVGRPWREIEIFQLMPRWPKGLDAGTHLVVFYSRTCDHCEIMFHEDLATPLAFPVIAIEIPHSKDAMTGPGAWEMPADDSLRALDQHLQLPMRTEWIIQSPLALRIEDGVITCANEGDHKECFGLQ